MLLSESKIYEFSESSLYILPSKGSVTSCPVLRFFFIFVQQDLEGHFQNEPEWKRYQRYTICILLPMKRLYCDLSMIYF